MLILALHRGARGALQAKGDIGDVVLRVGDVLLVQGTADDIQALRANAGLLVLAEATELPSTKKAPLALVIMAAVVVIAAFKLLPISISALVGALAMLLTKSLAWKDVGESLSTKVIMLVASSLALGAALTQHRRDGLYSAAVSVPARATWRPNCSWDC